MAQKLMHPRRDGCCSNRARGPDATTTARTRAAGSAIPALGEGGIAAQPVRGHLTSQAAAVLAPVPNEVMAR